MRKFGIGDKVFAKVRGYPAWPAKIIAIADETPNKLRYHVFFYGTLETAICKTEDLFPYAENKENYGKPSKRKFFNEGIDQIEGRVPVPDPRGTDSTKQDEIDSDAEGTLVIDENPTVRYGKQIKRKRDSDSTGEEADERKSSVSGSDSAKRKRGSLPAQKRLKKDSTSSGGASDSKNYDSLLASKPEIVSRSGRKIKPKRFADEDSFNRVQIASTDAETTLIDLPNQLESDTPKLLQHVHDSDETECSSNDRIAIDNTDKKFVKKDEKPDTLRGQVKERRKLRLKQWKKELQMLTLIDRIKIELNVQKANPEQGLMTLRELYCLGVDSLMLKKNPHVVEVVAKLVRYVGNPVEWKYSKEQKRLFAGISEKIRAKAKLIIDEFTSMFNVSNASTFYDVFSEIVAEFQEKTKELDREIYYGLTEDPTE